ncbi:MAG: crotonase/enoyl-CoA hydratase family protein [Bacteroidota bacterium]
MSTEIEITRNDGIQLIRFTRSEKKNAFTGPMYDAMSAALDAGETSDDIAVHVFIGSGGSFSAGNDINDFIRRTNAGPDGIPTPSLEFIRRLPKVTKPMIAAVDGLAIGVGTTMLLHCDLVYAGPSASLRTPFLDLGLVPEAASSLTTVLRMGHARAFELLCLGEPFDAERARQAGIINAVVPAAELEATALKAAKRLTAKPREALMAARRLMRGDPAGISARIEEEAKVFQSRIKSAEAQEAFAAFFEKRPPDFARLRGKR